MLAKTGVTGELFHTAEGTAYADITKEEGQRETWPIRSKRFRLWLRRLHYRTTGEVLSAGSLNSELDLLEARALFDGPERKVHVRAAEHEGRFYIDLANDRWEAIEITSDTWRVIQSPPVRFRRAPGMLPLPAPEHGGSVEPLRAFVNLASRDDFVLVVAWLLAALRPHGPYPVLAISGEQGSAKTVLSKLLRSLVDPNLAPVRALAREERDLMIAANNGHLLGFDNVSALSPWLSDALCRLASGGSFALRQLFTDQDEVLFQAARPILLNGIEHIIHRADLADRAIFLTSAPVIPRERRSEAKLWQEFEQVRPQLLGALLDGLVHGLRSLPLIRVQGLPRMADFALWATACEQAFWPAGTFALAYEANRRSAVDDVVDADPLSARIRELMTTRTAWSGTAADLLCLGRDRSPDPFSNEDSWPRSPRALAGRLRRAQSHLRALGIEIVFNREGHTGTRMISIISSPDTTVSIVSTVSKSDANGRSQHVRADGADGGDGLVP
jgi:hypothetical protein